MRYIIAALALALAGCAGSDSHMRLMEADNALRAEPVAAVDHDYVVTIRNVIDIGYDPDVKADRDGTALKYLATACPGGEVVGERMLETGTYLGGRPARTYFMRVRCP